MFPQKIVKDVADSNFHKTVDSAGIKMRLKLMPLSIKGFGNRRKGRLSCFFFRMWTSFFQH